MQFYDEYKVKSQLGVDDLVARLPWCQFVTASVGGEMNFGIFNHVYVAGKLILHLNVEDPQVADLKASSKGTLLFTEFFTTTPSYFVDANYGGAATAWYRYAECSVEVEFAATPEAKVDLLKALMDQRQPEGRFVPMTVDSRLYKGSIDSLELLICTPLSWKTKFKLGQNRPVETRLRVAGQLRGRNMPGDVAAASAIEDWVSRER